MGMDGVSRMSRIYRIYRMGWFLAVMVELLEHGWRRVKFTLRSGLILRYTIGKTG